MGKVQLQQRAAGTTAVDLRLHLLADMEYLNLLTELATTSNAPAVGLCEPNPVLDTPVISQQRLIYMI